MTVAGAAAPAARASGVARLSIAAQLLCAAIVLPWIVERLGWRMPDARTAGSILLLLALVALALGAWQVARRDVGARRALFAGLAVSAACSVAAQLHNVVRYVLLGGQPTLPSPGLLLLLLGSHPALLVGLARAFGWRRGAFTAEVLVDALLVVAAGAVVGVQLGYLAPWPVPSGDPAHLLVLLWRALPLVEISLVVLLVAARGRELGYGTSAALLGGVLAFAAANLFHGRLALVDQAAAVASTDALWALSTIGFALALLGRRGVPVPAADAAGDGLRGRFVVLATLVAAQGTLTLGLRDARSPGLAALLALFVLLLAVRGLLELVRQRRLAAHLESSVAAERALSQTLEHSVADRTAELADAHRALQRMWVLGQQLTQELRPQRVLDAFMDAVHDVAQADVVTVGRVVDDGWLRIVAARGIAQPMVGALVPMDGSAMGRVVRENRAWHAPDLSVSASGIDAAALRVVFDDHGGSPTGGLLVVPLHQRSACVGAVALRTPHPRTWGPEERARVEAMVDLLSVALANAEAVEGLRQAEWRFRTLFRAAPDAVLTLVAGGRVLEANDCAGELFGAAPAELVDRELGELVAPEDRAALDDALAAGFGGQQARIDVRVTRADGLPPRRLEIAVTRLPAAEPATVLLVGRDVTSEHDIHARLVEAERLAAVGELVAGVAHEVNNPLSSISAFAQLLLGDDALGAEQRESVEVVHAEALRAGQVVKDLLAFARRSAPRREAVDLGAIVERVLRLRGYQLASHNVRTDVRLGADVPRVLGDARQLQQVVLNLVTNALQAMPDGGTLRVATRRRVEPGTTHALVELEVADTGAGIAPAARSHIFEPFFTTKAEGQGTGLGLSVSYGIVAAHGGTLALADTSAAGTRFVVTLRAADPAAAHETVAGADAAAGRRSPLAGLRVLFVDDEPALRHSMETFGRRRGFTVVTAPEGRAALAEVEGGAFDAVVCDLRMPGMDGAAFYEVLRVRHPELAARTVMVTGDMMGGTTRFDHSAGPVTLGKPFGFDQLEETIDGLVRARAVPAVGR